MRSRLKSQTLSSEKSMQIRLSRKSFKYFQYQSDIYRNKPDLTRTKTDYPIIIFILAVTVGNITIAYKITTYNIFT